jgi:iron complex outermembrane receptor protein
MHLILKDPVSNARESCLPRALCAVFTLWPAVAAVTLVSLAPLAPQAAAQVSGSGSIAGRVQNAASGNYLYNARVRAVGTTAEAFTNAAGEFLLGGLPAGPATLEVFHTGFATQRISVVVPASGSVQQDVTMRDLDAKEGALVVMSAFTVASRRETDAASIALNEQRFAANRKDVVSTDAFGEINQGNIGEFVKFMPGISLDVKDGNTPSGIMIRGFDPNYTNVTMDGGQLASTIIANTQTSSRQFVLENANINNIARIEITKLPTPEMSANLLGGAVNFVSRSAFERPRRELRISTYLSANAKKIEFDQSPGPLDEETFKILPSFDLQFVDPVSKRFGYVVTAAQSSQFFLQNRSVLGHRFTSAGATPANPYTTNVNTNFAPNRTDRTSGAIALDFKPWDRHVLQFKLQANAFHQQQASRALNYNVGGGTPVSWNEHDTLGAATGGSVGLSTSFQSRHSLTRAINGGWTYNGVDWTVESAASWSHSNNRVRDMAKGFFNSVSVSLPNVGRVNLEGIDSSTASMRRASVFSTTGAPLNELQLANYNLTSVNSQPMNAFDVVKEARLSVTRRFSLLGTPVAVKLGGSVNDLVRDIEYTTMSWNFLGADGVQNSADDRMGAFVSTSDTGVSPGFGRTAPEWPDAFKVFQSWKNQPNLWTYTAAQGGDTVRNAAIRSPWLHETITAGYLMADAKLLRNRLRLVGGVRYELTEDEGRGFLQDGDAVYVKDAQGNPIKQGTAFVIRPELLPSGSLAYNSALYKHRGNYGSRDYDYFFPSAHVTYNVTDNILLRAAFARTMGRPNLSDIVPNLFVGENVGFGDPNNSSGSIPGYITAANSTLKPWRAKNYDYTVEYYLPRNGMVMFNWYRKDIRDFFSTITRIADAALLQQLGLTSDALGYQYSTRVNVADARIQGWEARVDLPLANLGAISPLSGLSDKLGLRHYTFTFNTTHLDLSGSRITSADWKRYIPRSRNVGLRFNFPKLSGMLLANWRGKMLRDTANLFPGANEYIRARWQIDGNIEYQFMKRYSVFFAGRNLFNAPSEWEVSGPGVPKWSTIANYEDYGAQYSLGIRATF